jgi:hypothetical protein
MFIVDHLQKTIQSTWASSWSWQEPLYKKSPHEQSTSSSCRIPWGYKHYEITFGSSQQTSGVEPKIEQEPHRRWEAKIGIDVSRKSQRRVCP